MASDGQVGGGIGKHGYPLDQINSLLGAIESTTQRVTIVSGGLEANDG